MAWVFLVIAGLFETAFAISLKASHGFTKLAPSILFVIFSITSFILLSLALKKLPVGTAYAVWTGIGTIGTAVLGMVIFNEATTVLKLVSIVLILAGVVGLRLAS